MWYENKIVLRDIIQKSGTPLLYLKLRKTYFKSKQFVFNFIIVKSFLKMVNKGIVR